jgi:hypothetical protein
MSEETKAKTAKAAKPDMDELVDFTAPLMPDLRDDTIQACVNGEYIRIKRGEPVKIKRKHYNVIMNAIAQERAAYDARRHLIEHPPVSGR